MPVREDMGQCGEQAAVHVLEAPYRGSCTLMAAADASSASIFIRELLILKPTSLK